MADPTDHEVYPALAAADSTETIHVGTRRSLLAKVQAREVVASLRKAWPQHNFEIHAMATTGDNNQKTALHKFNEKSLWTQELEVLMQQNKLDLIVHCAKDMPTQLPHDLILGAILEREDPRDAFVIKDSLKDKYSSLSELPEGSVVGTSSLRRSSQMKRAYPHLKFADVRGNVGTRLAKLDDPESEFSAIVIAVAGLKRLGLTSRITKALSKDQGGMLYAVGQGALALEIRKDDKRIAELVSKIDCSRSARAILAERQLMRTLEGGCSVPIGIETEWVSKATSLKDGAGVGIKPAESYESVDKGGAPADQKDDDLSDELLLRAIVLSLDGQEVAEIETRRVIRTVEEANEFGFDAAKLLVKEGADKILEQVQLNRGIIKQQGNA